MKKYNIEMEVVTPLSVGAGNDNEWMPGADFVVKDRKVYILDLKKVMEQGISIDALSILFVRSDENGIRQLLGNKLERCAKYIFNAPVSTNNSIKAFLRTQLYDRPLVAGSSLKGAIRSALFKYLRSPSETDNASVFGTMNNGTDFMRFIHISDFEMPATILVNTKLFNLKRENGVWQGGWKHKRDETTSKFRPDGFNTLYECVEPHNKGYGSIALDEVAFDLMIHHSGTSAHVSHLDKKSSLMQYGVQELFHIINASTREYLNKERDFFERYRAARSAEILDCIDRLMNMIPDDDSACLIKMSAGVGFHSITGDWKYDDYSNTGIWESGRNSGKKKYKSRKVAEYNGRLQLMGFVRLCSIEDRESIGLQEIENDRIIREAKVAEMQKKSQYQQLLDEANNLYFSDLLDEAIAKIMEAAAIDSDYVSHQDLLERCQQAKKLKEFQKKQEDKDNEYFQQPLKDVLVGKTSVGNIIGTMSKWLRFGHTFGTEEYQVLIGVLRGMSVKDVKKKRKDLEKAILKDWADKIMADLGIQ